MSDHEYACGTDGCTQLGMRIPELYASRENFVCPECKCPLETVGTGLSASSQKTIETFPYPIAYPLSRLHQETGIADQRDLMVDVLTGLLKFQALVVASEYLTSGFIDEKVTKFIEQDLAIKPSVSAWSLFLKMAIPRMQNLGHEFFAPELCTAFERAESKRPKKDRVRAKTGYYDDFGVFINTKGHAMGLIEALINYRNSCSHGVSRRRHEARPDLENHLEILHTLLEEMAWISKYTLLKLEDGMAWNMTGPNPQLQNMEWPTHIADADVALISPNGQALPVFPFLLGPKQHVSLTDKEDLLVYDQFTGEQIKYLGVEGDERRLSGPVQQWRQLINAKKVLLPELTPNEITPEAVALRAERVTKDTVGALHRSRKVLKNIYVSRADPERHLRFYPNTIFPIALITAQAGAGKTSLAHHMAEEWAKDNKSVVFLRAIAMRGMDLMATIREDLRLSAEVDVGVLAERAATSEQPLIIVIDGLNESDVRRPLLSSIFSFAEACKKFPQLKLLITWRSESTDWAEVANMPRYRALFLPGPDETTSERDDKAPSLHLGPWSHDDVAALWKKLKSNDNRRFSPRFNHEQVYKESRTVADLIKNPLLLRLFLEAFNKDRLTTGISGQAILQRWLERLGESTSDGNGLLLNVARILMERGSKSVPLQTLHEDPRTASELSRNDVTAPFRRLLKREGVLVQVGNENPEIAFTMDRVLEQAAGLALVLDGKAESPTTLVTELDSLTSHPLSSEIIKVALSRRVASEGREFLWSFIDSAPSSTSGMTGELIGRLIQQTNDPEVIATELMASPSDGDLLAAIDANHYLAHELQHTSRYAFLNAVVRLASAALPDSEHLANLMREASHAAVILDQFQAARQLINQALTIQLDLFDDEHPEVAMSYNNLGNLLRKLGEHEQARDFYEKSLKIKLTIFGEESSEVAGSYNNLGNLLRKLDEHEQARDFYEKSLKIYLSIFGGESSEVAASYNNLGLLLSDLDEHEQARDFYEKSLKIRLTVFGEEHDQVASTRDVLGDTLAALQLYPEAKEQYELAAQQGCHWSMGSLGRWGMLEEHDISFNEGLAYMEQAAKEGNEGAMQLLEGLDDYETEDRIRVIRTRLLDEDGGAE